MEMEMEMETEIPRRPAYKTIAGMFLACYTAGAVVYFYYGSITINPNGTATGNLTCGLGCGWNLNIQMSPDRDSFNLVDVDPANPGNFISGVAIRIN
jgi:hypothetical protein